MEEKRKLSRSSKELIRFFCLIGIFVEVLCVIRLFLRTNYTLGIENISSLLDFLNSDLLLAILDFSSFLIFIILIFVPNKFELFAHITFFYSFKIIAVETVAENPIGLLLYLLGIACLIYKGFYKKHAHIKTAIAVLFYFTLVSFSLRFGIICFINSLIVTLGYTLTFLVSIFFVVNFLKIIYVKKTARVWDLSQYPELTERDKEWLRDILDEKRYEEIAKDSGITVGTLKNRMHQIFTIVGIEDRISLLATYGGYEVKF